MSHVKNKMDIYFDNIALPSIVINIYEYRNGYRDIKRRGGKIRLRIGAPLSDDTPVKALATFSPLQKR